MGGCFNSMELIGKHSKQEVTDKFNAKRDQDGYESGYSYSGSFSQFTGLDFHDKLFDTYEEASDYVEEHGEKWGPAVCVRYKLAKPSKVLEKNLKALADLIGKIRSAERELERMNTKMRVNNRSTKPTYVIRAEGNLAKVKETIQPKIDKRTEKISTIRQALGAKTKVIRWYIGGWCSS